MAIIGQFWKKFMKNAPKVLEFYGKHTTFSVSAYVTVEPRLNEPLYNENLGITSDILQPGQSYSKMYETEPQYNEPRYNEILVTTSRIQKPKRKMYPRITNK